MIQQMIEQSKNTQGSSQDDKSWSESKQIYYYSEFHLFQGQKQSQYYQYRVFIEKVLEQLGHDWELQASNLYQPYLKSSHIFMELLEIWLRHHPIGRVQPSQKMTFNPQYMHQFTQKISENLKKQNFQQAIKYPGPTSLKAVCMGFFMTSNEIWKQMFHFSSQNTTVSNPKLKNSIFTTVVKKIRTFRPVMVVTQQITNVLGRKKRKYNEQIVSNQKKYEQCYHEFKRTLDIEKHLERKMSDFNLNEVQQQYMIKQEKIISRRQFKSEQSPVEQGLISSVYDYVTQFIHRTHSWQVAKNFVTHILDLNHITSDIGLKVKVLSPADDFYHQLFLTWLLFKDTEQNDKKKHKINFQVYLQRVKSTLAKDWSDKYLEPTKYFFERISQDWASVIAQNPSNKKDNRYMVDELIKKISWKMRMDWQNTIKISPRKNNNKYMTYFRQY